MPSFRCGSARWTLDTALERQINVYKVGCNLQIYAILISSVVSKVGFVQFPYFIINKQRILENKKYFFLLKLRNQKLSLKISRLLNYHLYSPYKSSVKELFGVLHLLASLIINNFPWTIHVYKEFFFCINLYLGITDLLLFVKSSKV